MTVLLWDNKYFEIEIEIAKQGENGKKQDKRYLVIECGSAPIRWSKYTSIAAPVNKPSNIWKQI